MLTSNSSESAWVKTQDSVLAFQCGSEICEAERTASTNPIYAVIMINNKLSNIILSPEELALELVNHPHSLKREIRYVRDNGIDLPVRILDIPKEGEEQGAPLIITFHGGVSGEIPYPYFYGHRFIAKDSAQPRTVLALCDPTLEVAGRLRFGWYAGYNGVDLPSTIDNLIRSVVAKTKPSRIVLTGGSTGAHAALRHVVSLPGAVMLGLNPLPRISNYWRPGVEAFLQACWPGNYDPDTLTCTEVIDDPSDLYAGTNMDNTFLFIQNSTDLHVTQQAAPMLEKLGRHPNMRSKVLAIMPFWPDSTGHSAPKGVFERWVEAAITSSSAEPKEIALAHEALAARELSCAQSATDLAMLDRSLAQELSKLARVEAI